MSDVREMLPVLLGVRRDGGSMEVRIDLDPESTTPDEPSVLILAFSGCAETDEARAEIDEAEATLSEGIGTTIQWEPTEWEASENAVVFYVNYGAIWTGLTYTSLNQRREQPPLAVVHQRVTVPALFSPRSGS